MVFFNAHTALRAAQLVPTMAILLGYLSGSGRVTEVDIARNETNEIYIYIYERNCCAKSKSDGWERS
jgi:hypothetical protein